MDTEVKTLAIDPGTIKIGLSVFENGWPSAQRFLQTKGDPYDRCIHLVKETAKYVRSEAPDVVICEYPSLFGGSDAGIGAKESGRILILFHFCGMLHYALRRTCPILFVLPIQWKGNLQKRHTQDRVFQKYGLIDKEDVIDAVGINDWYVTEGVDLKWKGPFLKKKD